MTKLPSRTPRSAARNAFTLVELLVVIGIIALLIGLLLPALNRARAQAQFTACLANLRSVGQALNIYMSTSKGTLPYGYFDGALDGSTNFATTTPTSPVISDWMTLLLQTMGEGGGTYGTLPDPSDRSIFVCPTASPEKSGFAGSTLPILHYSCHPRLMPNLDQKEPSDPPATAKYMVPYKIAHLKHSSDIILIFDGAQFFKDRNGSALPWASNMDQDGLYRNDFTQGRQWNFLLIKDNMDLTVAVFTANKDYTTLGSQRADVRWRHGRNDAGNFLFADGHAEGRRLKFGVNAELKLNNVYVNP